MTEERDHTLALPPGAAGPGAPPDAGPGTLQLGQVVAERFRVVAFLGRGGMAEVYEAEDLELATRVALKILRPELARETRAVERLKREIAFARQVTHRGVCRTFDVFRDQFADAASTRREVTGLTMELLAGETLGHRLRRAGPIPLDEALPLVRQMAEALAAAHAAGVVHRDFKSGNVMLVPDADSPGGVRAVVTDFGLARQVLDGDPSRPRLTEDNIVVGTADYMSPEQARGKAVTPAADVYALGVVVFEMVTGQRPHAADTPMATLLRRISEEPPSARALSPGVDPRWDAAIRRALATDPMERYTSPVDLVSALEGHGPPPRRRWRWHARLAGVTAALALVAALLVSWALLHERRPARQAPAYDSTQLTTWPGLELDPCFSPDGSSLAFSANRTGRFEIYVLGRAPGSRELELTSDGSQSFQPAWSPDGRWIVYHSQGHRGLFEVPALGGSPRRLTDFGSHPAWAPDGSRLAFQSDAAAELSANATSALPGSTLYLVAPGEAPRQLTKTGEPPGGHGAPAWAPDGSRVYFSASDRRTSRIWSVRPDGEDLRPVTPAALVAFDPVLDPDGSTLYFAGVSEGERNTLWRVAVDPTSGAPRGEPAFVIRSGASIRRPAISRDGRTLAHSVLFTTSNLWSLPMSPTRHEPAGEARPLTRGSGRYSRPAFSPDGTRIAYDRWQVGSSRDIWVMAAGGGEETRLTVHTSNDSEASWLPDGSGVAHLSDRNGRWSVRSARLDGGAETELALLSPGSDAARLSPDGSRLAFQAPDPDGAVNVGLAAADGSARRQLTFDPELVGFPCWAPDGRTLALEMRRGEDDHVVVVPSSGGEPVQLTANPGKSWPWSWSPDGDRIALARLADGLWNLWWVRVSSREQRWLTRFELLNSYVRYPAWSPRGDGIVFELAETSGDLWVVDHIHNR